MKKTILVTGSEGFIGSHLTELLVKRGYAVHAFVMYNSFNSWGWLDTLPQEIKSEIRVFLGDVRDPHSVLNAMRGCESVLHLAALIGIPYSYEAPSSYVDTNISGTLNVLNAARDLSLSKIVHTSTSEVYGTAQFVPMTEGHPLVAQSPYAATKIAADQLALSYHRSFDSPVTVLRPFNTYGPRQSARAVIPAIIAQLAEGGERLLLGNTEPTRDFNYVTDTANAFLAVLEAENTAGRVLNAGSDFEVSIGETARLLAEIMGKDIRIECDQQRLRPQKSDVMRLWADNSQLKELTGWTPEYGGMAGFARGLEQTVEWFLEEQPGIAKSVSYIR